MKNSERLREEAAKEDNDFRALALETKAYREEKLEKAIPVIQELIDRKYTVVENSLQGKFTIATYGNIDFYPKANRLFFQSTKKWKSQGLSWIKSNLLK